MQVHFKILKSTTLLDFILVVAATHHPGGDPPPSSLSRSRYLEAWQTDCSVVEAKWIENPL